MNAYLLGGLTALMIAITAFGQTAPVKKSDSAGLAEVILQDGSTIRVTVLENDLKMSTKYGNLEIPMKDVQKITFGIHYPEDVEKEIRDSIALLSSNDHRTRDNANRYLLKMGHYAYPILRKVPKNQDLETERRIELAMKRIEETVSAKLLKIAEYDMVQTVEGPIKGSVKATTMKIRSESLNELTVVKISNLRIFHGPAENRERRVEVDASKYGTDPNQWLETGVIVRPNTRLMISAEGQVDLWPQGPGQYVVTPKGYAMPGKGSTFSAGALVGRVGAHGKVFLIGERCECTPSEEGVLFLQIVPSPWNNPSSGSYTAKVKTSYKIP